ncbi:hypothetical protein M409DRAFT_55736 [Zasmidium cellare ATCC 36951]|uniref:Ubiquitin carboxyl-terminal hydrolase 19 n=1 Tax=Zasmidium cellare ATCC 36951 TaxID=1080233 RepID=A0A6A6CGK6_ZASCE|nr:uncharacterized protein M409DRAFT_55736 [Zasmidium cellare ATCC 36951]KAF2165320.1 hypothetical protein M409DRAFT_55736 [Zasmidium cellare ATCC 36951]
MDPQSQAFTPSYSQSTDNWRIQNDVNRISQIQAEHADRIVRLERRQDEDARVKSVWGNSSPFPSVLSGTPQQAPLQQPTGDQFRSFDDDTSNLMSSLHLDAEDEPRRGTGANSRANSVRFDESANQNHFSHSTRPSVDFLSRTSSGLGGLQMNERTSSHKSEGRASSAHSMRSAASGRANSLNLDTAAYGLSDRSPSEMPGLAPGLMLLGAVPAIIRCWMNTNFKHDALLYAAVCTGSYKSFLDSRLIQKLGFEQAIRTEDDGTRTAKLPIFFPEAVPHPSSSRSSSPAPSLPALVVEFRVYEGTAESEESKAIQIFLGSDTLRMHNADILFSSNSMTLFDNERNKLSIPLARPENEATFNSLTITTGATIANDTPEKTAHPVKEQPYLNGLGQASSAASVSSTTTSPPPGTGKYRPPGAIAAESGSLDSAKAGANGSDKESRPPSRQSSASRPSLTLLNTRSEREETPTESGSQTATQRSATTGSPAIWSNWRSTAATAQPSVPDWATASRNREQSYQRKDTGIKVLKPKTATRTFSSTAATPSSSTASPADGKSRFFDEGRRRSVNDSQTSKPATKENQASGAAAPKTKANPIGGASAFSWLNSGGPK